MDIRLIPAKQGDVPELAELRAAVAKKLTGDFGEGPWSGVSSEKWIRFEMRNSSLYVARAEGRLVATLRLASKKPWAIDRSFFSSCRKPLYLLSMAVAPEFQRQGIGRACLEQVKAIARGRPADSLILDSFDAPAGAGPFYSKCGFAPRGKTTFRGCALLYFELLL
jgi:GNAT superfamily N-acetyltransferase